MKAVVVHSAGDIRWEEVPEPVIPPGWVRVAVKAVGVCSSDLGRALRGSAYHYPIVLGHEIGGVVAEVGEGVDRALAGRRVAVTPLIPCGRCEWCEHGRYSMCDDYDYLGSRRDGGCAETVIAPERNLIFLPESVSLEDAGVLEPASVSLHGLDKRVFANDDVVVLGAGNLGLFAVQQALILGAGRVFVLDLIKYRLDVATKLGAIPIQTDVKNDGTQALAEFTAAAALTWSWTPAGWPPSRPTPWRWCARGAGSCSWACRPRTSASRLRTSTGWCAARWRCTAPGIPTVPLTRAQPGMPMSAIWPPVS